MGLAHAERFNFTASCNGILNMNIYLAKCRLEIFTGTMDRFGDPAYHCIQHRGGQQYRQGPLPIDDNDCNQCQKACKRKIDKASVHRRENPGQEQYHWLGG